MIPAPSSFQEQAATVLAHAEFAALKRRVIATTGLQYYADKDALLADRIVQRQRIIGCDMSEYFRRALYGRETDEFSALVDEITIGETYFFRYPEQFDVLRQYLIPERIAQQRSDRALRVWSAGCASGAEPYSLSILCRRDLTGLLYSRQVSILGTDINHRVLAQARTGEFSNWELRTMSDEMKRRCFRPSGKNWTILPEYRQNVQFEQQNLVTDLDSFAKAHAGLFDIILCRNVVIYFAPDIMRRVIQGCRECLASGGWLLVGHAEPYLEIANFLAPVAIAGITVYRKDDGDSFAAMAGRSRPAQAPGTEEDDSLPAFGDMSAPTVPASGWSSMECGSDSDDRGSLEPAEARAPERIIDPPVSAAVSADDHLAEIRRHVGAGDWTIALSACQQGISQYPLEPRLHYIHALVSEHLGSESTAERALGRAIYLDRHFALAHYHLGRCLAHRSDRAGALRSFRNALQTLAAVDAREALAMGDGLTVGELREITELQLGLLHGHADDSKH